jgi:hypothetical protein
MKALRALQYGVCDMSDVVRERVIENQSAVNALKFSQYPGYLREKERKLASL